MQSCHPSIFVVDDDQGILDSFDVMLGEDYPTVIIDNSSLAIDLLNYHNPKLIFLDLHMPEPDGLEVLASIRDMGVAAKVVIITALVQEHYQEAAEKFGIYRYLNKPLDVDEVLEIAESVIQ